MVDILNSLDVLAVQEHWLSKQSLSFLNSVHSDFNARGITSIDYGDGLSGRPHGGLFLWRRSHDPYIEPLIYVDEKRLLGLKITSFNAAILFLNVYLPYHTDDNANEYLEMLGKIQAISDSFEPTNIFIISDFNADIKNPSLFTPFLNAFINDGHLIVTHCFSPLLLLHMLVMRTAQGAGTTTCSPPTLITHQYLIWKLNTIVSLPTTYLYAFLYIPSYYLQLKPPYRSKFKHLVLGGMLPP